MLQQILPTTVNYPVKGTREYLSIVVRRMPVLFLLFLMGCGESLEKQNSISEKDQAEARRIFQQYSKRLAESVAWSEAEEAKWQTRLQEAADESERSSIEQEYLQFRTDAAATQSMLQEIVSEAKSLADP